MVLRGLFRLFTYPSLLYLLLIYYHAKSNDPDGFNDLRAAFNIPDFSLDPFQPLNVNNNNNNNENKENNENNDNDAINDDFNEDHQLDYPQPAPKPKNIKPIIKDMCQDLLELRQVLYDLATTCHFLQIKHPNYHPQKSKCFTNFPYYERPLNSKLLQNAHVYTAHIESSLVKINNVNEILKSSTDLNSLPNDIIVLVRECGLACLPLAEILYNQPELPESEVQEVINQYQTRIDAIDQVLQASLLQNQTNILSSQTAKPLPTTNDTKPDYFNTKTHKTALTQLNEHFEFLKEQKIITPERIDQKSLQSFMEYAKNIKFK